MSAMEEISTILFDLGGTLVDDNPAIDAWHNRLKELIRQKTGRIITDNNIRDAVSEAVQCYAPSFISYVIWRMVKPDRELFCEIREECDRFPFEKHFQIFPDAEELLKRLHGHFKLGLAANQRNSVYEYLKEKKLADYFDFLGVSDKIGFSKPDIRMFLAILENISSGPEETAMVGDRQDNDIVPAKLLGMKAIRLLAGPHKKQVIRYPREEADYSIEKLPVLFDIPFLNKKLKG